MKHGKLLLKMHAQVTCHHLSKKVHRRINSGLFFLQIIVLLTQRINALYPLNAVSPVIGLLTFNAASTDCYLEIDQLIKFVREIFDSCSLDSKGYTRIKVSIQVFMTSTCTSLNPNHPEGREHWAGIIYKDGAFIKGSSLVCVLNKYAITWRNIYSHSRNCINTSAIYYTPGSLFKTILNDTALIQFTYPA